MTSMHHRVATMNVKILINLFFSAFIFFFILLIVSAIVALPPKSAHQSTPLPPRHIIDRHHHRTPPPPTTKEAAEAQYQVFHIKNTAPFFLDRQSPAAGRPHRPIKPSTAAQRTRINSSKNKKRIKTASSGTSSPVPIKKKKKKTKKGSSTARPFSVMLPKGLVPPSGSSPACHNDKPDTQLTVVYSSCQQP